MNINNHIIFYAHRDGVEYFTNRFTETLVDWSPEKIISTYFNIPQSDLVIIACVNADNGSEEIANSIVDIIESKSASYWFGHNSSRVDESKRLKGYKREVVSNE